ncbi:hypothetical protein [Actimicrobium sp. CCI2.3]|uniref:hypothetical protein n=1 Tax=Actimicrobium sp. CCI2.3 TaxID=3048616 RepID=UPI002AB458BE|nr:hypothetical protein [Actimicrobium sp. CCI2.3]MDY7574385.1 hypothetical protein [Actimicrobium sp. CCI2.3]MEB0022536.1 hypothetical protein [Actimicrobium sp. CCI2.3]
MVKQCSSDLGVAENRWSHLKAEIGGDCHIKTKFLANTAAFYTTGQQQGLIDLLLDGSPDLPVADLGRLLGNR